MSLLVSPKDGALAELKTQIEVSHESRTEVMKALSSTTRPHQINQGSTLLLCRSLHRSSTKPSVLLLRSSCGMWPTMPRRYGRHRVVASPAGLRKSRSHGRRHHVVKFPKSVATRIMPWRWVPSWVRACMMIWVRVRSEVTPGGSLERDGWWHE